MGWVKRTGLGQLDTTAAQVAPQDECDERLWTGIGKAHVKSGYENERGRYGAGVRTLKRRPMMVILRFACGRASFDLCV